MGREDATVKLVNNVVAFLLNGIRYQLADSKLEIVDRTRNIEITNTIKNPYLSEKKKRIYLVMLIG